MMNLALGPLPLYIFGFCLLTVVMFLFVRRRVIAQVKQKGLNLSADDCLQGRGSRAIQLLEVIERRVAQQVAHQQRLTLDLETQKTSCEAAISEAQRVMGQLERLIAIFDDTFFARHSTKNLVEPQIFPLREEVMSEVSGLRDKIETISLALSSAVLPPSELSTFFVEMGEETVKTELLHSLTSSPSRQDLEMESPSLSVEEIQAKANRRQMQKLLKSGRKPEEIAIELKIPLDEVELIARILDPNREVA